MKMLSFFKFSPETENMRSKKMHIKCVILISLIGLASTMVAYLYGTLPTRVRPTFGWFFLTHALIGIFWKYGRLRRTACVLSRYTLTIIPRRTVYFFQVFLTLFLCRSCLFLTNNCPK